MPMSFNQIPIDLRTPGTFVEFDNSRAVQGLALMPNKVLLIGQRLAAGSIAALVPTIISNKDQAGGYFGAGSYLAEMCKAFKVANPNTEIWALALDDIGGGSAATGTITVTGTATGNGTLSFYIGGKRVQVPVSSGQAQNAIATAIGAAINAVADSLGLHVTATVATNVVTLTARHKGTLGNGINVRQNYQVGEQAAAPAGVTAVIVALSGGATDPDITGAIAVIGDNQYNTIATALADATSLTALEVELARRWGPDAQIEGHAFAGIMGTMGAMQTLGNARNSPHTTLMGGGKSPTPPWIWAAVAAAVDAGESDPARPRQTLPMIGVLAPIETERLTRAERNILLGDGVSTFTVDAGGQVLVERFVSTFQVNAFNLPDVSYMDITTLRTLAFLRFSVRARISSRYPRHKLASDGTNFDPGQAIVTPSVIRGEALTLFRQWEGAGLVENFDQFKNDLLVERDANNANRVNLRMSPDLMNQFMVFAGQVQFLL